MKSLLKFVMRIILYGVLLGVYFVITVICMVPEINSLPTDESGSAILTGWHVLALLGIPSALLALTIVISSLRRTKRQKKKAPQPIRQVEVQSQRAYSNPEPQITHPVPSVTPNLPSSEPKISVSQPTQVDVPRHNTYSIQDQPAPKIHGSLSAAQQKYTVAEPKKKDNKGMKVMAEAITNRFSRNTSGRWRLGSITEEDKAEIEQLFKDELSELLKAEHPNGQAVYQMLCIAYNPEKFDPPSAAFLDGLLRQYYFEFLDSRLNPDGIDLFDADFNRYCFCFCRQEGPIGAKGFPQDPELSVKTRDGEYDFEHFSTHEIDTIASVLKTARSAKYPIGLKGLGLANETSPIVYKPRYILDEIIIQKYKDSDSPFDLLAVGEAYNNQGARAYREALEYLLRYDREATQEQKDTAQEYLMVAREPSFSIQIALLYEKVGDFQNALAYAMRAMELDESSYHYTYSLVGEIYRKINPEIAIEFYQSLLEDQRYHYFQSQIMEEIGKVQKDIDSGKRYVFNPRGPSVKTRVMAAKITDSAKMFLPGGKYYDLVDGDKVKA